MKHEFSRRHQQHQYVAIVISLMALSMFLTANISYRRGAISTVEQKDRQLQQRQRQPSSFSTIFAGERWPDAVLFLSSLALHHRRAHVFIASDSATYEWFLEHAKVLFYHLNLHWSLALDKYDTKLDRDAMEAQHTWNDFMLEKVGVMENALKYHNDTILLDADFVLLEPVHLPPESKHQLGVSPHYMKASAGAEYGIYNGGMLWTNQAGLGDTWRRASIASRYFEQSAIEDLVRLYPFFEFGPEHNVGFWRSVHHESGRPAEFYKHLYFDEASQKICMRNRTVATVHTHILTKYPYDAGNDFSRAISQMLRMSRDPTYKRIAAVLQWAGRGYIPSQMVV